MLRAALQRRTERMMPTKGWEERVLAETTVQPRRRFRIKWLAIPAAAAVAAVALTWPDVPAPVEPSSPVKLLIAEAPQPLEFNPPTNPPQIKTQHSHPTPPPTIQETYAVSFAEFEIPRIEVDEELTVMQEIEALLYAYN